MRKMKFRKGQFKPFLSLLALACPLILAWYGIFADKIAHVFPAVIMYSVFILLLFWSLIEDVKNDVEES